MVETGAGVERGRLMVGGLIDDLPLTALQIRIIVLCALVLLLDGYDIQVMALAVPQIAGAWGLKPTSFGLALSSALLGIGVGAGIVAPFGDRFGRRPLIVLGLVVAAVATFATAWSTSLTDFVIWRMGTGIGIGACLANATTLTSEYMPARRRVWLTCVMYCNVAFGAFLAGFLAPLLLRAGDWRVLFQFGGAATLLIAGVVWAGVPESLKFLLARRPGHPAIASILKRLAPRTRPGDLGVEPQIAAHHTLVDLLRDEYRGRTLLLWTLYVLNVFVIYMLTSWLPTLLAASHWPRDEALVGAVLFQLGGVGGSVLLSLLVDRGRVRLALMLGFGICAAGLAGLLVTPSSFATWAPLLLTIGVGVSGAQCILVVLAAAFYPLSIRATGVGWAVTTGRLGAVAAPLVGAEIIRAFTPVHSLGLLIAPMAVCVLAALLVRQTWLKA